MRITFKQSILLAVVFTVLQTWCFYVTADTGQTVIWDKGPIKIDVPLGAEKIVHFDSNNLRVWKPDHLMESVISTENGVVFIYASEPFDETRIKVHDLVSQRIYYLDISSQAEGESSHLYVTLPEAVENISQDSATPNLDYRVELIRYALQHTVGVDRLRDSIPGVSTAPRLEQADWVRPFGILEEPIAAWKANGYRVDVIRVKNQLDQTQTLDIKRDIRGRWVSRHLYRHHLSSTGQNGDETLLILVSSRY